MPSTPLKMQFDDVKGELTIFVGAVRESFLISGSDSKTAAENAEHLFKLFRFAYSQGVTDAAILLQKRVVGLVDELVLER